MAIRWSLPVKECFVLQFFTWEFVSDGHQMMALCRRVFCFVNFHMRVWLWWPSNDGLASKSILFCKLSHEGLSMMAIRWWLRVEESVMFCKLSHEGLSIMAIKWWLRVEVFCFVNYFSSVPWVPNQCSSLHTSLFWLTRTKNLSLMCSMNKWHTISLEGWLFSSQQGIHTPTCRTSFLSR